MTSRARGREPPAPRSPVSGARGARKAVLAGMVGNFVEFYDATLYTLLAPVFAPLFFPTGNTATALLYTYGVVVGVGFVVRPIATVLLSPLGDRLGRRRLLALTLFIMGSGLLLIALTPTYSTIGVLAPVLLIIGRIAQNVSNSGEYQAAASFIVEHAPPHRRATVGSFQAVSASLGILGATLTASAVTALFPREALVAWGWRVAFLLGACLCLYGVHLRRNVPESPLFTDLVRRRAIDRAPLRTAVRTHRRGLLLVVVQQISQASFFTWQVFLPTYAHLVAGFPLATGLALNAVALACFVVALPLAGALADRVGRRPLVIAESVGLAVLAYPLLTQLQEVTPGRYLAVALVGNLLLSLSHGASAALFCELFPTGVRASGIGVPYQVANQLFGGATPIVATWTIARHHDLALAYYLAAIEAVAAVLFLFLLPETRHRRLDAVADDGLPGGNHATR